MSEQCLDAMSIADVRAELRQQGIGGVSLHSAPKLLKRVDELLGQLAQQQDESERQAERRESMTDKDASDKAAQSAETIVEGVREALANPLTRRFRAEFQAGTLEYPYPDGGVRVVHGGCYTITIEVNGGARHRALRDGHVREVDSPQAFITTAIEQAIVAEGAWQA